MSWYMLLPNPTLNIIIWFAILFFIGIVGAIIYFVQDWLRSDTVVMVNKDGSLDITTRVIKKDERISGRIERGKHTYMLEPKGVHTSKSFPQWKKIYVFDEGSPMPRILEYKKDAWFSTDTVQKVVNDTRIKQMTKEAIDPGLKLFIILGAIGGICAALASGIMLLMQLGIIGK